MCKYICVSSLAYQLRALHSMSYGNLSGMYGSTEAIYVGYQSVYIQVHENALQDYTFTVYDLSHVWLMECMQNTCVCTNSTCMYMYIHVCLIIRYSGELCLATDRSESGTVGVTLIYRLKCPFLGVLTVLLIEAMFGQS